MTVAEYFEIKKKESKERFPPKPGKHNIICMNEQETISLGLKLLSELDILHNLNVVHSNINPSSVYLVDQNNHKFDFLDLELAIWNPKEILGSDNPYFQQLEGDKYDTTFRDEDYLSPEHKELADEFQTTGNIPKKEISKQCDLYSIGAILFTALTGKPPVSFSEDTAKLIENDFSPWECPTDLASIIVSNNMAKFLTKLLAKDPQKRFKHIAEVVEELSHLKAHLARIPKHLLRSLEHISNSNPDIFEDSYVLELQDSNIDDFCQDYLYKFIVESNIPQIRLMGNAIFPIRALRLNNIEELILPNLNIHAEELKLLSFFIKINSSLITIDLSK